MITYIGIDPGKEGAIAWLENTASSITARVQDTPTLKVGAKPDSSKKDYQVRAMAGILEALGDLYPGNTSINLIVGIELVHAMPGQGVTSMWSMGRGSGLWEGIVAALGYPYEMITPQRWKKAMLHGMPKEKDSSRLKAQQLFPGVELHLRKHHGRADALLIAEYIRRTV